MDKRFFVLDSFRGIAAISVVIFHMHVTNSIGELSFFRNGWLFVEFFFILSGFVIAHSYHKIINFREFLIKRTFRLYPLHIFMFLVFFILELAKKYAHEIGYSFNNIPFSGTTSLTEIIPNLLFIQSWSPYFETLSWNSPSWSLSIEYYTYILFSATIIIFNKNKYISWILIVFASLFLMAIKFDHLVEVQRGLSCFFIGCLLSKIHEKTKFAFDKFSYFLMSFIESLLIFAIIFTLSTYSGEYKSLLSIFLFSIVIFIFSMEKGFFSYLFKARPLQELGKLSYSIYMTHAAVLYVAMSLSIIASKKTNLIKTEMMDSVRHIVTSNAIYANLYVIVCLTITVVISNYTYRFIEKNGIDLGKKILRNLNLSKLMP